MIYRGTEAECAAVIAQVDAELGYPRGYTQADLDSGLVVRHGRGPRAPIGRRVEGRVSDVATIAAIAGATATALAGIGSLDLHAARAYAAAS